MFLEKNGNNLRFRLASSWTILQRQFLIFVVDPRYEQF